MKTAIRWLAAVGALVACVQAQAAAVTFSATGDNQTLLFSTTQDGATILATVKFTLSTLSATSATFTTVVTNSSSGPGMNSLLSFGIDVVTPKLSGASTSTNTWDATINDQFPSFHQVALCVWAGNNCSGGSVNDGLGEGGVSTFSLTLTTTGSFLAGISFTSPYSIKFQSVGTKETSIEFAGCIQGTTGCGSSGGGGGGGGGAGGQVPEPDILALLGVAALAAFGARRLAQKQPRRDS